MKSQNSVTHAELLTLITKATDAALAEQIETSGSLDGDKFRIGYVSGLAAAMLQDLKEEQRVHWTKFLAVRAIPKWE
jgi:hypothetical protein